MRFLPVHVCQHVFEDVPRAGSPCGVNGDLRVWSTVIAGLYLFSADKSCLRQVRLLAFHAGEILVWVFAFEHHALFEWSTKQLGDHSVRICGIFRELQGYAPVYGFLYPYEACLQQGAQRLKDDVDDHGWHTW